MTCDEYQELASQYIDGELDDKDSEPLFKHLSTCRECRSFLRATLELRSKIHDEILIEKETQKGEGLKTGLFERKVSIVAVVTSFLILTIAAIVFVTTAPKGPIEIVYVTSLQTVEVQGLPIQTRQ